MASWWSFRVASIAAFWVVFVVAAANEADDTPLPNSTACPECAFGKWDCHKQCKPQNTLPHMDTDFTYKLEGCIEEVPAGDNIVQVDLDIECIYGFFASDLRQHAQFQVRWHRVHWGLHATLAVCQ